MRNPQVQSRKPSGQSVNPQATSDVSRVLSGFAQGTRLQGLSGARNENVHKPYTWASAIALVVALVLLVVSSAKAHVPGCHSRACDRRIHEKRRIHWKRTHVWLYRWHHLSAADRRWARCIAHWETYGTPWSRKARVVATNGHYGAMQFAPRTAVAAGFRRPVTQTTLYEQLVRGVWWRNRAGASQWATAGRCA